MIKIKQALVAAAALSLCAAASAANLVSNGSFETGSYQGWSHTGNTGWDSIVYGEATDGHYAASFGAVGATSSIAQTLATLSGATYELSFDLIGSGSQGTSAAVTYGSDTLVSFSGATSGYQHYDVSFTGVTAGALDFTFRNDPSYYYLDNVVVTQISSPVPEAASSSMLMAGLAVFGLAALRRRAAR